MAQVWATTAPDNRNFGQQIGRLADDLNRPDLATEIQAYLQDACRYFQRKPFFFNETDNSVVFGWGQTSLGGAVSGQLHYTQGATIFATASDGNVYAFVNLVAGTSGATIPTFTPNAFTPPSGTTSPPIYNNTMAGTTQDGTCLWGNAGSWPGQQVQFTQLCCVPYQNQYVPPLDYVSPRRVEVTWSGNLRIGMTKQAYYELRDLDVIRPTPPTTYPTYWAWFQQQIYFWPYPVGFYPVTLSYRTAPTIPVNVADVNFWTTIAEALIRNYAAYRISKVVLHDDVAAGHYMQIAEEELTVLTSEYVRQNEGDYGSGIPADIF